MQQDLPAQALQYLEEHPPLLTALGVAAMLSKPLTFLCLFLFIGVVFGGMVRKMLAPPPAPTNQYVSTPPDPAPGRRLAAWTFAVWVLALGVACEAVGIRWLVGLVAAAAQLLSSTLVLLAVIAALVYALAGEGRDLVLSLVGWACLQWHPKRPQPGQEFDLGNGRRGRVQKVDLLHTTFDLGGGQFEVRPNAWLMRQHFHWG
jgi:hypothetical protein